MGNICIRLVTSQLYKVKGMLLEKLSELGFDPSLLGCISLRAGVANAGVEDRLFKRQTMKSKLLKIAM